MTQQPIALSGALLTTDTQGNQCLADEDVSGKKLFAGERLIAAQHLATKGFTFRLLGSTDQIEFFKMNLPGSNHLHVANPGQFPKNTLGNVDQLRELITEDEKPSMLLNFYHAFRWHAFADVSIRMVEAELTVCNNWGRGDLKALYGTSEMAERLINVTLIVAQRIANSGDVHMSLAELQIFDDIIAQLPSSSVAGPLRQEVHPAVRTLFIGDYLERVLDELLGVVDHQKGNYVSLRPGPNKQ